LNNANKTSLLSDFFSFISKSIHHQHRNPLCWS